MTFGQSLKKHRLLKGFSQADMAIMCHTKQNIVSMWENDKIEPSLDKLVLISNGLNISLDRLLGISKKNMPSSDESIIDDPKVQELVSKLMKIEETKRKSALKIINGVLNNL